MLIDERWDLVITVCESAKESCPVFLQLVERLHISFEDPAEAEGNEEERMAVLKCIRDEICERLLPEVERRS